ncbi:MAG TPA: hypothetical protein VFR31_04915 [Thermoanaerobaculia bacterium]|nr:hypothetical protein [Thermoanaerobaculia bacterium]
MPTKVKPMRISVPAMLSVSLAVWGCDLRDSYVRAKQIRTFADLQTICAKIEQMRSQSPHVLEEPQIAGVIASVANGRDAWGNPIKFSVRPSGEGLTYVLVSYGSDGKSAVDDFADYFDLPIRRIEGQAAADIVFRDGKPVTSAGK